MSDPSAPPKIENAPGLVFRERKVGWVGFWQCRSDIAARGFRPNTVPLWRGVEPSRLDRVYISDCCIRMQNEMLTFARGGVAEQVEFNQTVRSLIGCYKTDPDSGYRNLRYRTRVNYDSVLRRLERDLGDLKIEEIDARMMRRTHEKWTADGHVAMAHSLVGMLRTIVSFGATMLKNKECRALKADLSDMKFKMSKPRLERLTAEQAAAVCVKAHEAKVPEVALAQAIQFECMLRQKDIIGEWVPEAEPGITDVTYAGQKWLMGIRWNEIDENLTLRHNTSKRGKDVQFDLRLAPMVLAEFKTIYGLDLARGLNRNLLPLTGPVIVNSVEGRPFQAHQFRRVWRKLATWAGVPKAVRNMDSRAGAISEASDAGAEMEHIRHAATHSDIKMTSRYSRGAAEKTAVVAQKRAEFRQNKTGK